MDFLNYYLSNLLRKQQISIDLIKALYQKKYEIQRLILEFSQEKNLEFFFSGSIEKKTLILESFDGDIFIIFPINFCFGVNDCFFYSRDILLKIGYNLYIKNIALRIFEKFHDNKYFHIDIIPGKAMDVNYEVLNVYKSKENKIIETKMYILGESTRYSYYKEVIKLLKLWNVRNQIDCPSFILELIVKEFFDNNIVNSSFDIMFMDLFDFIAKNILTIQLHDFINPFNYITDKLHYGLRVKIQKYAQKAIDAKNWFEIFLEFN